MATKCVTKREKRIRRHKRIRKNIAGTAACPRFCVSCTLKHIYLQIINDELKSTLLSVSTKDKEFVGSGSKANLAGAAVLGRLLGERAVKAGVGKVIFDRGGFKYHGRVKALAEAARKAGLKF